MKQLISDIQQEVEYCDTPLMVQSDTGAWCRMENAGSAWWSYGDEKGK